MTGHVNDTNVLPSRIEALKRERADYLREASDHHAWTHHRVYAIRRASEINREIADLEAKATGEQR